MIYIDKMKYIQYFLFGATIGYVSWGHTLFLSIFALFIIYSYFTIDKRLNFFFLILGYYLAGSRGLFAGTIEFYNVTIASGVYLGTALVSSLAWIICWGNSIKTKLISFGVVQLILILPPVGLISYINPIISSALLAPYTGYFGFFIITGLIAYFTHLNPQFLRLRNLKHSFIVPIFLLVSIESQYLIKQDHMVQAINSNELYETGTVAPIVDYTRQIKYLKDIEDSPKKIFLLPENALGYITGTNEMIWQNTNKTIFAGGSYMDKNNSYTNSLSLVKDGKIKSVYNQRIPVPISMWKPWSNMGAKANIWGDSIFEYNNKRYGVLICYEQLLMLPWLQTMSSGPDTILAISNLWWARDTSIYKIEEQNIQLWALLFNKPYVFSYNK